MPKKTIMIEVTAELIAMATKADSSHCMIADAIKAALPQATAVSVDLQTIRYSEPGKCQRRIMLTPQKCQEKLVLFDQGVYIKPWSFRLPDPIQTVPIRKQITMEEGGLRSYTRLRVGPRVVKEDHDGIGNRKLQIEGGHAPPVAILSNSSRKTNRRIFGLKAAGDFDPTRDAD